jgi:hypothetical protein
MRRALYTRLPVWAEAPADISISNQAVISYKGKISLDETAHAQRPDQ